MINITGKNNSNLRIDLQTSAIVHIAHIELSNI